MTRRLTKNRETGGSQRGNRGPPLEIGWQCCDESAQSSLSSKLLTAVGGHGEEEQYQRDNASSARESAAHNHLRASIVQSTGQITPASRVLQVAEVACNHAT